MHAWMRPCKSPMRDVDLAAWLPRHRSSLARMSYNCHMLTSANISCSYTLREAESPPSLGFCRPQPNIVVWSCRLVAHGVLRQTIISFVTGQARCKVWPAKGGQRTCFSGAPPPAMFLSRHIMFIGLVDWLLSHFCLVSWTVKRST